MRARAVLLFLLLAGCIAESPPRTSDLREAAEAAVVPAPASPSPATSAPTLAVTPTSPHVGPTPTTAPVPSPEPVHERPVAPSPAPRPTSVDLVLTNATWHRTSSYYYLEGEVTNPSEYALEYTRVSAALYNQTMSVVGAESTYADRAIIPPRGVSTFSMIARDPEAEIYAFNVTAEGRPTTDASPTHLVFRGDTSRQRGSYLYVTGEVVNTGTHRTEYVQVLASFAGPAGFLGVDSAFVASTHLDPGEASPFEIIFDTRGLTVDAYRLWVD